MSIKYFAIIQKTIPASGGYRTRHEGVGLGIWIGHPHPQKAPSTAVGLIPTTIGSSRHTSTKPTSITVGVWRVSNPPRKRRPVHQDRAPAPPKSPITSGGFDTHHNRIKPTHIYKAHINNCGFDTHHKKNQAILPASGGYQTRRERVGLCIRIGHPHPQKAPSPAVGLIRTTIGSSPHTSTMPISITVGFIRTLHYPP